ncbi:PapI protein [Escherichia coli]|nr:PapI protein [Escherichia coli]AUL91550.1 PapI protein [Escherichia coli]AUM21345.1 PapI protein [Escherichia coli]
MLPSEIMIWQPEFTDKILSRKPGAVQSGRGWKKPLSSAYNSDRR